MKVLQVHLSEEQHKRLRVMSAERCVAMSELVRWWIDAELEVDPPEIKTLPVAVSVPNKGGVASSGTCSKCGAVGVKTALNKEMKEVCYACAAVK